MLGVSCFRFFSMPNSASPAQISAIDRHTWAATAFGLNMTESVCKRAAAVGHSLTTTSRPKTAASYLFSTDHE